MNLPVIMTDFSLVMYAGFSNHLICLISAHLQVCIHLPPLLSVTPTSQHPINNRGTEPIPALLFFFSVNPLHLDMRHSTKKKISQIPFCHDCKLVSGILFVSVRLKILPPKWTNVLSEESFGTAVLRISFSLLFADLRLWVHPRHSL